MNSISSSPQNGLVKEVLANASYKQGNRGSKTLDNQAQGPLDEVVDYGLSLILMTSQVQCSFHYSLEI